MRTRRAAGPLAALLAAAALAGTVLAATPGGARAQDALSGVGPGTQVRSVKFVFEGKHILNEKDLKTQVAITGQGKFVGLRKALAILPLIPPVGPHPFDPVELQRDVVRLREFYRDEGFLHADVRYDVRYDAEPDLVWVTYRVTEGPPLTVQSLTFEGVGDSAESLPAELRKAWRRHTARERRQADRLGERERRAFADSASRWFRDRGYPFASAEALATVDTAASKADVTVRVTPGDRARIAAIDVEGNATVPERHFTRQMSVEPGDWYSARRLEQSRLQLTQLDIVRLAVFDAPRRPVVDSAVTVRLDITENPSRLINGDAGFSSDGGLTAQSEWTHRSFLGGVRTLTFGALAQSGVLALEQPPQRLYRGGVRLFQPYVGSRLISAAGGPFVEYRDDFRDRSWAFGFEGSVVLATSPLKSLSLGYSLSRRRVLEYGIGADLGPIAYLPLLGLAVPGAVDTLGQVVRRNTLTLQGSYGTVDEFTYPRKGYVVRPRVEVTLPGFNSSEYLLLDLGGSAFLPLSRRFGLAFRGSTGRIYPYGRSVTPTANESPVVSLLRLGDVTFTAGGTRDVRGWGTQLVGPKLPDVQVETVDGAPRTFAERYTPIGGLARLTGSAELRMKIPGLGDAWEVALFTDGGRIWIPDRRFALNAGVLDQDDFYAAAGIGFTYVTVVGAVQFAIGYKLNPSAVDVRPAAGVLDALTAREPVTSVEADSRQRLHLHFALGTTF
jgi:outer membrane protein insertion porin family